MRSRAMRGCAAMLLCGATLCWSGGCATASSRVRLVRERAELDLGCPADAIRVRELPDSYLDEQLQGGTYQVEGCGTRATYQLEHCGLGAAPNGCRAVAQNGPGAQPGADNVFRR